MKSNPKTTPKLDKDFSVTFYDNDTTVSFGDRMAGMVISPTTSTERIIKACEAEGGLSSLIHTESLRKKINKASEAIKGGSMELVEEMLIDQAISLQQIFTRLTEKALCQSTGDIMARYIGPALRAQDQSRRTLETLGTIKNPTVVFAKQANVATNQQINHAPAPANEANKQSELLEQIPTNRLEMAANIEAGVSNA